MEEEAAETDGSVSVSMEVTGDFDEVMSKLQPTTPRAGAIELLADDLEVLLETIVQIDGGTRSAIATQLSDETAVDYDAQAVVETLQVLERYDLVVLEGNTWKPGPELQA